MTILQNPLPESVKRVQDFIQKQPQMADSNVSIYVWAESKHGIRVAEVGGVTLNGRSGWAFMQTDTYGGVVCFYAERLAIEYESSDEDNDIEIYERFLLNAMFGGTK